MINNNSNNYFGVLDCQGLLLRIFLGCFEDRERGNTLKIIKQLLWLILFSFLGEGLSLLIKPVMVIPGSVIGMVCLLVAFRLKILPLTAVEDVGQWLTSNMAIFFVPAGVALMTQFRHLGGNVWWQLLLIIFITTTLMMIVVGKVVDYLIRQRICDKSNRKEGGFHDA